MTSHPTPGLDLADFPEDQRRLAADRLKSLAELRGLSIVEVLEQDSRPTLVIDLDPDEGITVGSRRIQPIFCNSALRLHERLLDVILGKEPEEAPSDPEKPAYENLSSWATGVTKFDNSRDVSPRSSSETCSGSVRSSDSGGVSSTEIS